MTASLRPRCDIHGRRCPLGSHAPGDDSHFGWDEDYLTGRDYDQACLDDADAMARW